jgi:hypothetical protein
MLILEVSPFTGSLTTVTAASVTVAPFKGLLKVITISDMLSGSRFVLLFAGSIETTRNVGLVSLVISAMPEAEYVEGGIAIDPLPVVNVHE